jgi:hypothetical protein
MMVFPGAQQKTGVDPLMHCDAPGMGPPEQYRPDPQGGIEDPEQAPLTIVWPDGQQNRGCDPLIHCDEPGIDPTEQYRPDPQAGSGGVEPYQYVLPPIALYT